MPVLQTFRCLENGCTLLHRGASCGATECVQLLLRCGADANLENADGENALHVAARIGSAGVLRTLLRAGANPSATAPDWLIGDNQTVLMIAAYNNHCDVVTDLLPVSDVR